MYANKITILLIYIIGNFYIKICPKRVGFPAFERLKTHHCAFIDVQSRFGLNKGFLATQAHENPVSFVYVPLV